MTDDERYLAEFEVLGEDEVRARYEKGRMNEFKSKLALHWLGERDRRRHDASQAENAALARSAAIAARDQADAALEANRIAEHANTIAARAMKLAIVAIIVSIITLFVK